MSVARGDAARRAKRIPEERRWNDAAWRSGELALLLVIASLPFLPALRGELLTFDDDAYVSANRFVLQGPSAASVAWAFTTFTEGNYHPLTWLSLMLDAQIFDRGSAGFHLTNVLLHGANATLLFSILLRAGVARSIAFLGALLWAVHPLRVESVAWVSERKDVLSTLFGLLAIRAYLAPRDPPHPDPGRIWRVAAWMTLSLLSKAMFVTLPALLLLLDVWPLARVRSHRRELAALALEKWPLWLLSAGFGALAVLSQQSRDAVVGFERMPLEHRLPNAVVSYGRYLVATLWPQDLAAFYPFPIDGWPPWLWIGTAVALALVTGTLWRLRERWPSLLVGWGWFAISLLPVSGVLQTGGQAIADRYTYLPAMGLMLGVAGALPARAPRLRSVAGGLAVAACLVLAVLTWRQTLRWRDTVTLMEHTLSVTGPNPYAKSMLAHALMARGDGDAARALFEDVLRVLPNVPQVHVNLGVIAAARGDHGAAIRHYRDGIRLDARSFEAYNNLAASLLETQSPTEASAALEQALRLRPDDPDALFNLGLARLQSGDLAGAAQAYQAVVALVPDDVDAHYRLGAIRLRLGDTSAAIEQFRATLALQPGHAEAASALRHLSAPGGAPAEAGGAR